MEPKKKKFLDNLRFKPRLLNLKKQRKNKPLAKQPRTLANRRSVSVPDLTFIPGEADSPLSPFQSTACDAVDFLSYGQSDTDSVASSSISDGSFFQNKLGDPFTEILYRVPQKNNSAAQVNRVSGLVENFYEDVSDVRNSSSENKLTFIEEGLYTQVDKNGNKNAPKCTFEPATKTGDESQPDRRDRLSMSDIPPASRRYSESVNAYLNRAHSMGNEKRPLDKKTPLTEPKSTLLDKGPIQTVSKDFSEEMMSLLDNPDEVADVLSSSSAMDTPMEEQTCTKWIFEDDEEELEQESSYSLMGDYGMDEGLELEESLEEVSLAVDLTSYQLSNGLKSHIHTFHMLLMKRWAFL